MKQPIKIYVEEAVQMWLVTAYRYIAVNNHTVCKLNSATHPMLTKTLTTWSKMFYFTAKQSQHTHYASYMTQSHIKHSIQPQIAVSDISALHSLLHGNSRWALFRHVLWMAVGG